MIHFLFRCFYFLYLLVQDCWFVLFFSCKSEHTHTCSDEIHYIYKSYTSSRDDKHPIELIIMLNETDSANDTVHPRNTHRRCFSVNDGVFLSLLFISLSTLSCRWFSVGGKKERKKSRKFSRGVQNKMFSQLKKKKKLQHVLKRFF